MTKQESEETRTIFYGIHPKTFEVVSVYLTKGNSLHYSATNGASVHHPVLHGREPRAEIVVVWGLTDIISFPPFALGSDSYRRDLEELEAKAAEKRNPKT